MSRWLSIMLLQEPFDMGLDPLGRGRCGFNFIVEKTPSDTFMAETFSILVAANVGVVGTNIFGSTAVAIPEGDGPYLLMIETGGPGGVRIHNQIPPAYQRPGAQIVARAKKYANARTMAVAAYNALSTVCNRPVTV